MTSYHHPDSPFVLNQVRPNTKQVFPNTYISQSPMIPSPCIQSNPVLNGYDTVNHYQSLPLSSFHPIASVAHNQT